MSTQARPRRSLVHSIQLPPAPTLKLPTVLRRVHGRLRRVKLCPPAACEGACLTRWTAQPRMSFSINEEPPRTTNAKIS